MAVQASYREDSLRVWTEVRVNLRSRSREAIQDRGTDINTAHTGQELTPGLSDQPGGQHQKVRKGQEPPETH